jgi:hypothetical protein
VHCTSSALGVRLKGYPLRGLSVCGLWHNRFRIGCLRCSYCSLHLYLQHVGSHFRLHLAVGLTCDFYFVSLWPHLRLSHELLHFLGPIRRGRDSNLRVDELGGRGR